MAYTGFIVFSLIIAAAMLFLAIRLLINLRWILGFVRGSVGLGLIALAGLIALCAVDFNTYHPIREGDLVGKVSFVKKDEQLFQVTFVDGAGNELRSEVYGDLWLPSVRVFDWSDTLRKLGLDPAFRVNKVSGQYFALEQEEKARRNEPLLVKSKAGADLWRLGYSHNILLPGVSANLVKGTLLPMADGALFEVRLARNRLVAKPANDPAQHAVSNWR
jgi:hypothetical protein